MSSPTPEPVAHTSSYGTPSPSENINDERLPPRPVAHGTAVAADAASPQEHTLLVKRTLGVSHSSSGRGAPPVRWGNGKRQKTAAAREDLCCFCSIYSSCTSRNCPCAKAGRPCHSCDQKMMFFLVRRARTIIDLNSGTPHKKTWTFSSF